jgi:hypothetical protein
MRPQGQFTIAPTFLFGSGYAGVGNAGLQASDFQLPDRALTPAGAA